MDRVQKLANQSLQPRLVDSAAVEMMAVKNLLSQVIKVYSAVQWCGTVVKWVSVGWTLLRDFEGRLFKQEL